MDFREYAAKETAASLRRAQAGPADVCRQQLAALRTAVDAAAKALEAAAKPSPDAERDFSDLAERLTEAATEAADAAVKRVSDAARKTEDSLRADLQAQTTEKTAAAAALQEAQTDAAALRAELATAVKRADGLAQELAQSRDAAKKLEAERRDLATARDAEKLARTTTEGELKKSRDLLEKARGELAPLKKKIEALAADKSAAEDAMGVANSQTQAAEAKLGAVTELLNKNAARVKQLERQQQVNEHTIKELQARQQKAAPNAGGARMSMSMFEELLGAFQALASATTISDVLTTMIEQMATEFSRVALFRVKSNHLQGEHQIGFDLKHDISKVIMPSGMDSLLTRAAGSGTIERLSADELADSSRVPFSGTPSCAIALPVVVGDETLAVVYADDSGTAENERGPDAEYLRVHFADAMLQYAVSLLMRMKDEMKALAELRSYADSLVHEIEEMYVADAAGSKSGAELKERLKSNLEYARSMFANRIALEQTDATGLLDEAIDAIVSSQPSTPFGRDLAVVCGHSAAARKRSAEAS
jgi:predicted  nucleic acid-binding Zn-ribbon protein